MVEAPRRVGDEAISELVEYASERGAYWIEEPVEPDDKAGYVALSATGAPLAGGESEETSAGLIELGRTEAVDFSRGTSGITRATPAVRRQSNSVAAASRVRPTQLRHVARPRR